MLITNIVLENEKMETVSRRILFYRLYRLVDKAITLVITIRGIKMFTIDGGLIGDFKLGDNINHNLRILSYFYRRLRNSKNLTMSDTV